MLRGFPQPVKPALLKRDTAHDDLGENIVPLRRNMFVGDLHIPLLAGHKRRSRGKKQALLVAQDDLLERIVKFHGDFNLVNFAVAAVLNRAEYIGYFLVQEIGRAAHLGIEKMNLRGVGLLGRPYDQGPVVLGNGWSSVLAIEHGCADQHGNNHDSDQKCDWQAAAFFCGDQVGNPPVSLLWPDPPRRIAPFKLLAAHSDALDQREGQAGFFHAFLNRGNIVGHAPEFYNVVIQIGDGKGGSRISIPGLADGARIQ